MQCRRCGTDIADKALICYRCGTATTEAKFKPAAIGGGRSTALLFQILLIVLVLLVLWEGYAWMAPPDPWSSARRVAIAAVLVGVGASRMFGRR